MFILNLGNNSNKYFSNHFSKFSCNSKLGVKAANQTKGRASGGLLLLNMKQLKIGTEHINVSNYKAQAQTLKIGSKTMLWINCYCPCDRNKSDISELTELLDVIKDILETFSHTDVLIEGDINWDPCRSSPASK